MRFSQIPMVTWLVCALLNFQINIDVLILTTGGGYILSKAALTKLVSKLIPNKTLCRYDEDGAEDLELGLLF